ncbi:MAG: hypothetical protein WBF22_10515 [Methylocella sp.]
MNTRSSAARCKKLTWQSKSPSGCWLESQYSRLPDGAMTARVAADPLGGGMGGKPWILAKDRPNWDFGKTTINSLMISVIWNGAGVPLIWTLLPPELSSNGAGNSSPASACSCACYRAEPKPGA